MEKLGKEERSHRKRGTRDEQGVELITLNTDGGKRPWRRGEERRGEKGIGGRRGRASFSEKGELAICPKLTREAPHTVCSHEAP